MGTKSDRTVHPRSKNYRKVGSNGQVRKGTVWLLFFTETNTRIKQEVNKTSFCYNNIFLNSQF
jgi:hypothetical protein